MTLFCGVFTVHWEVSKLKTLDGEVRFPCLVELMTGLLTIPVSNAHSESDFSIFRKIHTDQRPSLKPGNFDFFDDNEV